MDKLLKSKFKIGNKISENHFSLTYDGETLTGNRPIIIKIYKRGTLNAPLIKIMKQKVRILQEQIHPRIVPILDGDYGWQGFYFVRPFIKGKTLKELLIEKAVNPSMAEDIILQICEALSAAHKRGITHGALLENNIFIDSQGIKLVDFVIEGEIKESLPQKALAILDNQDSLSPEELSGCHLSFSSDIFAAGVLFYKLLSFSTPFKNQIDKLHGNFTPIPQATRYQQEILQKVLSPDPLLRFRKISDFAESIKNKTLDVHIFESDIPAIELENLPPPQEKEIHTIKKEQEKSFFLAGVVLLAALAGIIYAIISSVLGKS